MVQFGYWFRLQQVPSWFSHSNMWWLMVQSTHWFIFGWSQCGTIKRIGLYQVGWCHKYESTFPFRATIMPSAGLSHPNHSTRWNQIFSPFWLLLDLYICEHKIAWKYSDLGFTNISDSWRIKKCHIKWWIQICDISSKAIVALTLSQYPSVTTYASHKYESTYHNIQMSQCMIATKIAQIYVCST